MTCLEPGPALNKLIAEAVREHNVLPLTGRCNMNCIFCSHRNNPPGTEAFSFPALPQELLFEYIPFLDHGKKVIIGESATRLREGEPLTHPHFFSVLRKLRSHYPETMIQITTNGSLLTEECINELLYNMPVEVIVSLNSGSEKGRNRLMVDSKPWVALNALTILIEKDIPYHGSMVALPHITGWGDFLKTVYLLDSRGAQSVRVLLPGFSSYCDRDMKMSEEDYKICHDIIKRIQQKVSLPVLAEPPLIEDLKPVIEGVFAGTPAAEAGLKKGDLVLSVSGQKPFSRVGAFELLKKEVNPEVIVKRDQKQLSINLFKEIGDSPGAAFAYDLDPLQVERLQSEIPKKGKALMFVSASARQRWELAAARFGLSNLVIKEVLSLYFGGSINSAGLLTVSDYQSVIDSLAPLAGFSTIILPAVSFDNSGHDMAGQHYLEIDSRGLSLKLIL